MKNPFDAVQPFNFSAVLEGCKLDWKAASPSHANCSNSESTSAGFLPRSPSFPKSEKERKKTSFLPKGFPPSNHANHERKEETLLHDSKTEFAEIVATAAAQDRVLHELLQQAQSETARLKILFLWGYNQARNWRAGKSEIRNRRGWVLSGLQRFQFPENENLLESTMTLWFECTCDVCGRLGSITHYVDVSVCQECQASARDGIAALRNREPSTAQAAAEKSAMPSREEISAMLQKFHEDVSGEPPQRGDSRVHGFAQNLADSQKRP